MSRVVGRKERTLAENFVDFKEVKEHASIEGVLARYHVQLRRVNKHSLRGKCPLPTHSSTESKESFCVQVEKKIWSCQSQSCVGARDGKKGGNVLDLVALMESCSVRDAAIKLRDWFAPVAATASHSQPTPTSAKKEELVAEKKEGSESGNKPLTFTLKDVDPSHAYFKHRGIREETARHFGVGYFPGKGSMAGRVVIPIHNEREELVAYAGRSIDNSEPKYKLPSGFVKSAVLFNLHRVQSDSVIIVEGFFDCLKVWQSGSLNAIALIGCSLSETQEKLLEPFTFITIFLDGDEAGREAASAIASRLVRSHFVRVIDPGDGKQPDQLSSEAIQNLIKKVGR